MDSSVANLCTWLNGQACVLLGNSSVADTICPQEVCGKGA